MNLLESIRAALEDMMLTEMAYKRREAIEKISNLDRQIARHLVLVLLARDRRPVAHWMVELNGWLNDVDDLADSKSGRLSADILIDKLYENPLGEVRQVVKMVDKLRAVKGMTIDCPSPNETQAVLKRIIAAIAKDIAADRLKPISEYLPEDLLPE